MSNPSFQTRSYHQPDSAKNSSPLASLTAYTGRFWRHITQDLMHNGPVSKSVSGSAQKGPQLCKFEKFRFEPTPVEIAIIETPSFRRLYGVQQMVAGWTTRAQGLSDEPSTDAFRHTRGSHSEGVYRAAAFLMAQNRNLPSHIVQAVRLAALLHDIGHCPFSHAGETILKQHSQFDVAGKSFDHDHYASQIILNGDIGEAIRSLGAKSGVTPEMVVAILKDEVGLGVLVKEIADRFDYLERDSRGSRFSPAVMEQLQIVKELCLSARVEILPHADLNEFNPADSRVVLPDVSSRGLAPDYWVLLLLRQALYQEYSVHPTAVLVTSVLECALKDAFDRGCFDETELDFRRLTDQAVISKFSYPMREMFHRGNRRAVDDYFTPVRSCTLADVRDHNRVTSDWFRDYVYEELCKSHPELALNRWQVHFCVTEDYSKTVTFDVAKNGGEATRVTEELTPHLRHRAVFLALTKDMPQEFQEAVAKTFERIMADELQGAQLSKLDIFARDVDVSLFLQLGRVSGAPASLSSAR